MQSLNTILFINKKVSYRKQFARQQSCSTVLKRFLTSSFITVQKFGCCFSYCERACRRLQNLGDAWATPPWEGVADPLKHVNSHLCYHTKFSHSRSNRLGVDRWSKYILYVYRGPKNFEGCLGPAPLRCGRGWPLEICVSHLCYHAKFGHSGSNSTNVRL